MSSEITKAMQFICDEKGLDYADVLEALETAMGAAYRKDFGHKQQNLKVKYDPETGDMQVWDVKEVVADMDEEQLEKDQEELQLRREKAREEDRELEEEEVDDLLHFNPKTEMMIKEAVEIKKDAKIGDTLEIELEVPTDFGRMAAQTAKQVIIQKIREAERSSVFDDLSEQVGTIIQGVVHKRDRSGMVLVDLGKITGYLFPEEQIRGEQYRPGMRMRFFLMSAEMTQRGPQIMLSRSSNKMVESVFEQEIPEIASGDVEIKGIARDPGFRSKLSVHTDDESIDPIGACIGQRGSRITTIIEELGGEKVDIIQYKDDAVEYIKEALSPAKVDDVEINEAEKTATAHVAADQFSLAIGRKGQNVRLAAELTGYKIDVLQEGGEAVSSEDSMAEVDEKVNGKAEEAPTEDESDEAPSEGLSEPAQDEVTEEALEKSEL
ncbi:transcription termination/antitermination protein NusA [Candidatus Nomurabacteria bacterium]|nr:transcription termination/antitermination protein NusA [Candidatus Nomurabacteria bacterium]